MDSLLKLYKEYKGTEPASCQAITGSGSNRQYYRMSDEQGHSIIGVKGTSDEENRAFIYLSNHFRAQHLPVPEVLVKSDDNLCYLQQDLGNKALFDELAEGRKCGKYNEHEVALLERVMTLLPDIQYKGAEGLDFSVCYPQQEMDETNVMFDLNYFKYCFLKPSGVDFHEMRLEADFRQMARDICQDKSQTFLYRDFQARNIMLDEENNPYFIDFQGGRRGPIYYDVASFLWQASARYSDDLRQHLIEVYLRSLQRYTTLDAETFNSRLQLFVLFRTLQVLGAYGYRGYFERKKHFLDSIPPAIENLRKALNDNTFPYPHLTDVLKQLIETQPQNLITSKPNNLTVRVFSFSYKKGIPEDTSGNGGGYVFDCRSTHNPGRYDEYKQLTGLDEPVIRFLEDDGEILTFLESVYRLAEKHVERYIERGFTNLMFSFGCTGGQHRSVYSAQHLAEHLHKKYGIRVLLCHREQHIEQCFE